MPGESASAAGKVSEGAARGGTLGAAGVPLCPTGPSFPTKSSVQTDLCEDNLGYFVPAGQGKAPEIECHVGMGVEGVGSSVAVDGASPIILRPVPICF